MKKVLGAHKVTCLRKLAARFLDFLYPSECALCGVSLTHGKALCEACREKIPRLAAPFCQVCGEMFPGKLENAFSCPNCEGVKFSFQFARPALSRSDQALDLIHRLKYGREIHLARELGLLVAEALADERLSIALQEKWPLVPVPLHRRRLSHRHFNQAEEIARALSKQTGQSVLMALRRVRNTHTQTQLSRKKRMENLRDAFAITRHGKNHLDANIPKALLIDDVFTTGSTVNACAKALRRSGFREIIVLTVVRG